MSQENQSYLRFSLEESLWFRKGQEVEELVSISLDPDITIQENDQYVTIRGSLELTGEYKSYGENEAIESSAQPTQKYVHQVEERDGGVCEFSHRFPVDITIPNNRIQSIYDIDVMVETFDYSLPERSCLKLSADLTISGLYDGVRESEDVEVEEELAGGGLGDKAGESWADSYARENSEADEEERPLFVVEARKPQEEESSKEAANYPTFSYQPQDQSPFPDLSQQVRSEVQPKIEIVTEEETENVEVEVEAVETEDAVESDESSSSSPTLQSKLLSIKEKITKKKSMSLTEFFARKEEREEQAKLKVYIVQKGDTIDRIAERYDITFQNLLRVNHLEVNQDVFEGQVLYIPVAVANK